MFVSKKKYEEAKHDLAQSSDRNMQLRADLEEEKASRRKAENESAAEKARADALSQEVERLAELLNAKAGDCKVGPWCEGCKHLAKDSAAYEYYRRHEYFGYTEHGIDGVVRFCKKHIHEICGEFEDKPKTEIVEKPVPVPVPYVPADYSYMMAQRAQNEYLMSRLTGFRTF